MKKLSLLLTILMLPTFSYAVSIDIEASCEVTGYFSTKNVDGKPEYYNSTSDWLNKGDKLKLIISLGYSNNERLKTAPDLEIRLITPQKLTQEGLGNYLFRSYVVGRMGFYSTSAIRGKLFANYNNSIEIAPDLIKSRSTTGELLTMKRYYKSDWSAIYTSSTALNSFDLSADIVSFNCMSVPDLQPLIEGIDESSKILSELIEEKKNK